MDALESMSPAPIRSCILDLPGSRIREVADEGLGRQDVIALWFGEGDRRTPELICNAATSALRAGHTFYTENRGIPPLRQAVADYVSKLRRVRVTTERVTVTPSGVNAIMTVMQCLIEPGDNVVLVAPAWPNCADAVTVMGGEVRRIALQPSPDGWKLDIDRLAGLCDCRTRAIFVNSPSNPTGWMATREELAALLEISRRRGCWLIADEVYERLVYDAPCSPSPLDIATPEDLVISINSFSKSWNMTGWRLGWLVTPQWLGSHLAKLLEINMSCAPPFVQEAGIVALQQGEEIVRANRDQYAAARLMVLDALSRLPQVMLPPPPATFYAYFRVEGMTDSRATARRILSEAGIGLAPGVAFGAEGEGWLRMCFAAGTDRIGTALERLAGFLSR